MSGKLSSHEKEKGTYFSVVTNDFNCRENIKTICLDFPYWAWIDHYPDDEEGKEHTHFLLRANGTRSVKQMADKCSIPSNYVQVVRKVVAYRRYLMHLDNPEKHQYTVEDVHTNHIAGIREAVEGEKVQDVYSLFTDFRKLSAGHITPDEFIQLHYTEMSKMAFSQKIKTFETLLKTYSSRLTT